MSVIGVVTGAFGFSGRHIAKRLLERGQSLRTLTNHPDPRSPLYPRCQVAPLDFAHPDELARNLEGAEVLYNTYWVRFAYGGIDHAQAVENTRVLIRAAERAGVRRIVHLSISNPSPAAATPYFRGKAAVEEEIRASSLSYAILRPTVLFGHGDILINNIAYLLRRFPVFAIPGKGDYKLQPIWL
jgi:NADH dehydrogenase